MIPQADVGRIAAALPFLATIERELVQDFARRAVLVTIPAGRDLMAEGDRAQAVPVLVSGQIRVFKIGESGREITLYRFGRGECCVLTAESILGHRSFPARARVEEEGEAIFLPAPMFEDWIARSPTWRQFIFDAMARRFTSLMDTVDDVAFRRMDIRVSELLLTRSGHRAGSVRVTHQEIADELGSSREVVSRILEDLKGRGLVRLFRGGVEVLEPQLMTKSTAS
ncbi:MAG: Crp/Fnr family transcriptional regulator [Dehalococcoidia bacterium]